MHNIVILQLCVLGNVKYAIKHILTMEWWYLSMGLR